MAEEGKELLEAVRKRFTSLLRSDTMASKLLEAIQSGKTTFEQAENYATRIGELLAKSFEEEITADALPEGKLTREIAAELLRPMLQQDYNLVTEAAAETMEALNHAAGLQLKAVRPAIETDRVEGLIEKAASYDSYDQAAWVMQEPVIGFSQHVTDRLIEENVNTHFKAGLSPKIERKAVGGGCKWCEALAGKYDYPVSREIYRRHRDCRCLVLYDPGEGKVQNAHTKKVYVDAREAERESRRERAEEILQKSARKRREKILQPLLDKPENLKKWSPGGLKTYLEKRGFEVKPLAQGSLKGIPFEEGGGWKINFGDGGLVQYHPATKSHHDGEYWKISTGKGGIQRYDRDGKPKEK